MKGNRAAVTSEHDNVVVVGYFLCCCEVDVVVCLDGSGDVGVFVDDGEEEAGSDDDGGHHFCSSRFYYWYQMEDCLYMYNKKRLCTFLCYLPTIFILYMYHKTKPPKSPFAKFLFAV